MRMRFSILLIIILTGQHSVLAMCPFCPPASVTLSDQIAASDAVVLASWVKTRKAKGDEESSARTVFEIVALLKNFREALETGSQITVPEEVSGQAGNLFLLLGSTEGREVE